MLWEKVMPIERNLPVIMQTERKVRRSHVRRAVPSAVAQVATPYYRVTVMCSKVRQLVRVLRASMGSWSALALDRARICNASARARLRLRRCVAS